ncbi:hypothetical protein V1951_19150 [Yersinia sp. 2544 StPb PI]|uniref:hypothetical protein n=1 Tax=Yersinia sp. 2544 StPb PI TaxID=3117409 RepID=UPI003B27FFFD
MTDLNLGEFVSYEAGIAVEESFNAASAQVIRNGDFRRYQLALSPGFIASMALVDSGFFSGLSTY